ncbi:MAG: nitrite reductase, copper-containing [Acidobacteriia bacterium]|nr:nitrite reductase, copper-containing [Terriglobia bacterium]MYC65237.1 nitrite reductase, copper-containing [Terriglobia bacterium]
MSKVSRRRVLKATGAIAAMPAASQGGAGSADLSSDDIGGLPRIKQDLVEPPLVPKHEQISPGGPVIVEVELVAREVKKVVDGAGTEVHALTFNGSIPGPLIVCHEGDFVELTLRNPRGNAFMHNIDFHASTGGLGGGALTQVNPGEQVVLRWRATKPGTFIYHCAPGGSMIPYHVVSGMNGAVMVLPREGLSDRDGSPIRYDRAYYVGEQDLYVPRDAEGNFKRYTSHADGIADTLGAMRGLIPSHVVFNGGAGSLTGDQALRAKVGEAVLFIHSQANRDSRPHLIGGHGDYVWEQGSFSDPPAHGLETWFIRGGSAGAAIYTFRQPGVYNYLNHNLIEAVELGALAQVVVEGEWDETLMKQVQPPGPIPA